MQPIPRYGDHMTLKEWVNSIKDGGFIDYDGYGKYATVGQVSSITVSPSDVKKGNLRTDFTHIVWFNR